MCQKSSWADADDDELARELPAEGLAKLDAKLHVRGESADACDRLLNNPAPPNLHNANASEDATVDRTQMPSGDCNDATANSHALASSLDAFWTQMACCVGDVPARQRCVFEASAAEGSAQVEFKDIQLPPYSWTDAKLEDYLLHEHVSRDERALQDMLEDIRIIKPTTLDSLLHLKNGYIELGFLQEGFHKPNSKRKNSRASRSEPEAEVVWST